MSANSSRPGGVPGWMAVGLAGAYTGGVVAVTLMAGLAQGPLAALPFFLVGTAVAAVACLAIGRRLATTERTD